MQNKVMKVSLPGGIIGLLIGDTRFVLEKAIQKANELGWRVIQIESKPLKNLLNYILDLIVLLLTLLLYTRGSEYLVKLERDTVPILEGKDESLDYGNFSLGELRQTFSDLPPNTKRTVLIGSVVYLLIAVGLFLFKVVPPYLAKMKAEKIASIVNAVKTAEPEQIDVPLLSKQVIKGNFKDNPDIQSYTGIYSVTSEDGDMTTQTSLEIKLLENDKAEMVLKTLSGGLDGEGNPAESEEKIEPPKQAEIVGNALILETGKGRFTTLTIRDDWGRVRNTYGLIFNGTFYERTGDLIGSSSNVTTAPTPKPETTAPQPPTRVEQKQPTPSVPNEMPAASSGNNSTMGIITGDGVRMRSSMDKTSKTNIIDKFAKGTKVEILERNGEWVKVRVKGKVGYIASQFVE